MTIRELFNYFKKNESVSRGDIAASLGVSATALSGIIKRNDISLSRLQKLCFDTGYYLILTDGETVYDLSDLKPGSGEPEALRDWYESMN